MLARLNKVMEFVNETKEPLVLFGGDGSCCGGTAVGMFLFYSGSLRSFYVCKYADGAYTKVKVFDNIASAQARIIIKI